MKNKVLVRLASKVVIIYDGVAWKYNPFFSRWNNDLFLWPVFYDFWTAVSVGYASLDVFDRVFIFQRNLFFIQSGVSVFKIRIFYGVKFVRFKCLRAKPLLILNEW